MARYTKDITLNKPEDFVTFIMNDFLQKNNFVVSEWKGEPAYRAGDALVEGYKYFRWSYVNGVFHMEAWLKGSFGKEMGLTGFVAIAVKKPYMSVLEQLEKVLQQPIPEQGMQGGQGAMPVVVQTVDNTSAATRGLVLGILSCVLCLFPLFGILVGCIGFASARMGLQSSKAKSAKIGRVLCIIGIILSAVLWIASAALSAAMAF